MAKINSAQLELTEDDIEIEVTAALSRIATETSMRKLYGTAKSPGVFIGEKELQKKGAQLCIDQQLILEAGVTGKGKSAQPGYIITEKGLKFIEQANQRATINKWATIDQMVGILVEEHNDTYQVNFLDKTKKIEELKARFQADLKKLIAEQTQRFDRLIQQVHNTLKHDFEAQAQVAVNQLMHAHSGEIDKLIEELKLAQHKLQAPKDA